MRIEKPGFVLVSGKWPKYGRVFKGELEYKGKLTKCEVACNDNGLIFYHGWSTP